MPSLNLINKGFTLIELVIGIVVFSIVLVIMTSLIAPQAVRSVEPILQVRASELAQSLLNEITAKSFDENSNRTGGFIRCHEDLNGNGTLTASDDVEDGERPCTVSASLGADGETRALFDDVDDYQNLDESGQNILNSQGNAIQSNTGKYLYQGFRAQVSVIYDNNYDGIADSVDTSLSTLANHKLIRVTVTTPTGQAFVFSTYRSNF